MWTRKAITVVLGLLLSWQVGADAAEYFVTKQGNDANNGASREMAFLTIQKGVDALQPGDTLKIGPGEYFETVRRAGLGDGRSDTVIRAEIPRTVLLRGDVPAPDFKKVEGYRFIYSARFAVTPEAVLEHGAMRVLEKKPNVMELEFEPGSMFYDGAAQRLYISTASQQPPEGRLFTVVVTGQSGLQLTVPKRVTIEGIGATGFHRTMSRRPARWIEDYQWGIVLDQPTSCTVRDCRAFLNCGGIMLNNGRGNVVENCVAHDNADHNIQYFGGDNNADNAVRNCYAYRSGNGIDSYTGFSGPMRFENNVAWGHGLEYSTKGGNSQEFAFMEGCVALGNIRIHHLKNCIFGGRANEYNREAKYTRDNIVFSQEEDLDIGREFADPINMDWRLQSDSRFVGAREDGKDRGLYPEHEYTIYFLSPDGDDENDGTSVAKAWKTLSRAVKALEPGDTLYLTEGVHRTEGPVSIGKPGAENIHIRGRGRDRVTIQGVLNMTGSAEVEIERVSFANNANAKDSEAIVFTNCAFDGLSVADVKGLKVTHSLLAGAAMRLEKSSGVHLSGNIFANARGVAVLLKGENDILYSDYNSYQDGARCWLVGGEERSLDDLRARHDRYSIVLEPELAAEEKSWRLTNPDAFAGRGPQGTSLGRYQEYEEQAPGLVGPFLHSVTDTTANIEWWTSVPATCEIAWGETPEMENNETRTNVYRFTSFSLTDLEPGRKYYFAIRAVDPSTKGAMPLPTLRPDAAPLTFSTAAEPHAPVTYYVVPDGNDANDGLARNRALRSVTRAAALAKAGDTVLIGGGTYSEFVRVRATGTEGKPITFKAMPGEQVTLNGSDRGLSQAMAILNKSHINIDGLYITMYAGPGIYMYEADDVRITRCFANGAGPGYAGPLAMANDSANLLVRNCLMTSGMGSGLTINHCPDAVIEHNVFLRNLIYGCVITNGPDERIDFRMNIACDSLPYKVQVQLFEIASAESFKEKDNCYFLRIPDAERKMFMFYGRGRAYILGLGAERAAKAVEKGPVFYQDLVRVSLAEFQEKAGDTGSFVADPEFKGTQGMEAGGKLWTGDPATMFDKLLGKPGLDFPDAFATDPRVTEKNIGLVPEDFEDFWFNKRN